MLLFALNLIDLNIVNEYSLFTRFGKLFKKIETTHTCKIKFILVCAHIVCIISLVSAFLLIIVTRLRSISLNSYKLSLNFDVLDEMIDLKCENKIIKNGKCQTCKIHSVCGTIII